MYTPANFDEINGLPGPFFIINAKKYRYCNCGSNLLMMKNKDLILKVDTLISPTIESMGYELIETEYLNENGRWILRLYVDNPDRGINLEDCQKISHSVGSVLDVEDVIPGRYNLEVSSPGLERPVRKEKDFQRFAGSTVKIRTVEKIGDRKNFTGMIEKAENGIVTVFDSGQKFEIPIEKIVKARLHDEIASGGKKNG